MQENKKVNYVLGFLRLIMGWIFLWAFMDKLWGLGFATTVEKSWLAGGSPTGGFLQFAVHGPFKEFYNSLAGVLLVDWLFMLGLLFVGVALMLGIFTRLGGLAGVAMLLLMYTAIGLSPANNPVIDDHIIYILVMIVLMMSESGKYFGLGVWWSNLPFIQRNNILK